MNDHLKEEWFDRLPYLAKNFFDQHQRPLVIISYAQSIDGSIASRNSKPLQLSCHESMLITHRIRAVCDAITIGINTLLMDDPLLTVRFVEGTNPQPIVLDSRLRTPLKARLLNHTDHHCWLASLSTNKSQSVEALEARGVELIYCNRDHLGRVDLPDFLHKLGKKGITSLMVEGGSQVITSFIEAHMVDQMIITIAPHLVAGLPLLNRPSVSNDYLMHLQNVSYHPCGEDILIWGQPRWQETAQ